MTIRKYLILFCSYLKPIPVLAKLFVLEKFFEAAEQSAASLPLEERGNLLHRLKLARDLIGSTNALEHFLAWKAPDER